MAKMSKKMVAICSTAVATVYMAGYYVSEPAQANESSQQIQTPNEKENHFLMSNHLQKNQKSQVVHPSTSTASKKVQYHSQSQQAHAHPSRSISSKKTPKKAEEVVQTNKIYKDGTFTGQGMNRIGSVEVAVTIKKDKIIDVQITNCDTSYSESYIEDLPKQVLQRQSSQVDVVSGATRSTEDFQNAVDEALQQAKL